LGRIRHSSRALRSEGNPPPPAEWYIGAGARDGPGGWEPSMSRVGDPGGGGCAPLLSTVHRTVPRPSLTKAA